MDISKLCSEILLCLKQCFVGKHDSTAPMADSMLMTMYIDYVKKDVLNGGEKIIDLFAELEHQGKVLQIFSPISGEITALNPVIVENPELLNEDPYGKGWMFKIKPTNWISDTSSFYLAEAATKWSESELVRFKDFLATTTGKYEHDHANVVLQDGGELRDHTLSEMPEEVWKDFQDNFLSFKV